MRVITGSARGRKLKEPVGRDIRPTTDKVKESLFNIVQFDIEGRRVLDMFAGTGQLGIEALSRGAREAVFLDEDSRAVRLVRENLAACGLEGRVLQGDAIGLLRALGTFDVIFIDPPYDAGLAVRALEEIKKIDILSDGGIIVCETRQETELPMLDKPYFKGREYRYGKVKLTVYGKGCSQ